MGGRDQDRFLVVRINLLDVTVNISFNSGSSLKNHGVIEEVNGMFSLGEEAMKLPLEEKLRFEQGNEGSSFG